MRSFPAAVCTLAASLAVPAAARADEPRFRFGALGGAAWSDLAITDDEDAFTRLSIVNRSRLLVYARVDLRLTYEPRGPKGVGWYVECLNVLDRLNPIYVESNVETDDRGLPHLSQEPGGWFPRLFSTGFRWRF